MMIASILMAWGFALNPSSAILLLLRRRIVLLVKVFEVSNERRCGSLDFVVS